MIAELRQLGLIGCSLLAVVGGCAASSSGLSRNLSPAPHVLAAQTVEPGTGLQTRAANFHAKMEVEPASATPVIEPASFTTEVTMPSQSTSSHGPSATPSPDANRYSIDLASALQLAAGQNPNVAFARERINEAYAQHERATALWLPSIRAGANWNKHEGTIQDVAGTVFNASRGSWYGGLGANAVGAGSPGVPGIVASFHLTDAIHQPKIAEHAAASRQYAASAAEQDVMLQTALAYLDLLKAHQELAIARDIQDKAQKLSDLTKAYADSGQGLAADYDRARTELSVRQNDVWRADEGVKVANVRLAQLLHIDPTVTLLPNETTVVPLAMHAATDNLQELVASGLSQRPEICEQRLLVEEACERLRREKNAPLLPSVLLGLSYGGLGGGTGDDFAAPRDRFDADAVAYWEVRNLGWGESAARKEARSRVQQAQWRELATLDRIAREVAEAHAQVESRRRQLAVAETGVAAATSSFERNHERIHNAQGLPLETLQSLQALALARRDYVRTITDFNTAQFTLQRALGWPSHE